MGRMRYGVHRPMEDEADRIIAQSLKTVTRHSDKSDILTPWKADDRKSREVYTNAGVPDRALRQGMFHRAWNRDQPHLNSRDGVAQHSAVGPQTDRNIGGTLAGFVGAQFDNPADG